MNTPPSHTNDFDFLLNVDDIICQTPIQSWDELVMDMLKRLAFNHGIGNVPSIFESVQEREAAGATIVTNGIAIPHARITSISKPFVAIATSAKGINFNPNQTEKTHLVILALVPKDQPCIYLQIIAALAKTLQTTDAAEKCAQFTSPKDVVQFFKRDGLVLPDFICAADIMQPVQFKLLETNSLKDAIDLFVGQGLTEIPVVDKEGDLTGVVSAAALLRVCMPDYLLWMDDLSPILKFEPFVNILRNEENTWLSEILNHEFPSVDVAQPAIAVAESMAKRNASTCYVLEDKKLKGKITLPHFLDKVLRD